MNRKTRQFLKYAQQLDEELEKSTELFIKQRPFLENPGIEPEFLERSDDEIEEKITNDYTIKELTKRIEEITTMP